MTVDVESSQIAVFAPASSACLNLPCFYRYEARRRLMSASNFNCGQPCERALKSVLRMFAHAVGRETHEIVFLRRVFPPPFTLHLFPFLIMRWNSIFNPCSYVRVPTADTEEWIDAVAHGKRASSCCQWSDTLWVPEAAVINGINRWLSLVLQPAPPPPLWFDIAQHSRLCPPLC